MLGGVLMSKARVSWAFQERPVSSSKMNQANTDYITPGVPIWSYFYSHTVADTIGAYATAPRGFFPYNPQKSVHNRLYIFGFAAQSAGGDQTAEFDVSFDGGATWTPAFPSVAAAPVTLGAGTLFEIWDLDVQVATFQWIGWRWAGPAMVGGTSMSLGFQGFLYRSTDTPF